MVGGYGVYPVWLCLLYGRNTTLKNNWPIMKIILAFWLGASNNEVIGAAHRTESGEEATTSGAGQVPST